jgi:hypothetical protein
MSEDWRAVAPPRNDRAGSGSKNLMRIPAMITAVAFGLVAIAMIVKGGGGSISAAALEQADAGLIAQEAMTKSSIAPSTCKLCACFKSSWKKCHLCHTWYV